MQLCTRLLTVTITKWRWSFVRRVCVPGVEGGGEAVDVDGLDGDRRRHRVCVPVRNLQVTRSITHCMLRALQVTSL